MYKLSLSHKIEQRLFPNKISVLRPSENIEWLVYHVPKTAGSSLRYSFTQSFGKKSVFGVYRNTGANELLKGNDIWLPKRASVVFGHVPTHLNHIQMFPNAKRVTWVREPLERIWSLLGHYLELKKNSPRYNLIETHYLNKGITKKEYIFESLIKDKLLTQSLNIYANYFGQIPLDKFDFVGSLSKNREDLSALQKLIGRPLFEHQENVRNTTNAFPKELRYLEKELEGEYEIVADYL